MFSALFLISCNWVEFNPAIKPTTDNPITVKADTVHYFISTNTNGSWNVLFLFPKEKIKGTSDTTYYYIGNVTNWVKQRISIPDKAYMINGGKPERVSSGGYIGVNLTLSSSGLYNIALVYSGNLWADLSGSAMIKLDNAGLLWFYFDKGVLTPKGDPKK